MPSSDEKSRQNSDSDTAPRNIRPSLAADFRNNNAPLRARGGITYVQQTSQCKNVNSTCAKCIIQEVIMVS